MSTQNKIIKKNLEHTGNDRKIQYLNGLTRAFGGTLIFTLPLLMTMEMWYLGFYMDRLRLVLLILLLIPLLVGLSFEVGFREDFDLISNTLDAFTAYAVGFISSAVVLFIFNIVNISLPLHEIIGKIAIQSVPASIGAIISRGVLGGEEPAEKSRGRTMHYLSELFIMAIGALFLAFNLTPTEEMILISLRTTEWHVLGIMVLSVSIMHAFVYAVDFGGRETKPEGVTLRSVFFRLTLTGYAVVLLMSFYILWTFGRVDALSFKQIIMATVVLSLPASIGAAAARLII